MQKYNFFLLPLFFGIGFFCISCAMEQAVSATSDATNNVVSTLSTKNDSIIDIGRYWPDDYRKTIDSIQEANLPDIRSRLKKDRYLFSFASPLEHLLYLSTIRNDNKIKTPFTQKQQHRFDTVFKIRRRVSYCFGINAVMIGITAFLPFTNLVSLWQCSLVNQTACLTQVSTVMIPATITVAGALVVGFASLYGTGILPNQSAKKADKLQDEIGDLSRIYSTVAKFWIDMHFNHPDKAQYIADKFNIAALKTKIKSKTYNAKSGRSLINPLEEAWHFITHKTILVTFTEMENYLYHKMNYTECRRCKKNLCEKSKETENI